MENLGYKKMTFKGKVGLAYKEAGYASANHQVVFKEVEGVDNDFKYDLLQIKVGAGAYELAIEKLNSGDKSEIEFSVTAESVIELRGVSTPYKFKNLRFV
jgi:hypothetical protein